MYEFQALIYQISLVKTQNIRDTRANVALLQLLTFRALSFYFEAENFGFVTEEPSREEVSFNFVNLKAISLNSLFSLPRLNYLKEVDNEGRQDLLFYEGLLYSIQTLTQKTNQLPCPTPPEPLFLAGLGGGGGRQFRSLRESIHHNFVQKFLVSW